MNKHKHSDEQEHRKLLRKLELSNISFLRIINVENEDADYCFLEAPDERSVEEFHSELGLHCYSIDEVLSISEIQSE